MPIPAFSDEDGFLPPGVHDCSLAELRERFGSFQRTDQRCRLFEKLERLIQQIKAAGLVTQIIVDGSFVTAQESPNDIDLVLVVPPTHDVRQILRPMEYNSLSKHWIRRQFGFDAVLAKEGSDALTAYLEFFAQVRKRPDVSKGLVRITV